MLHWANYSVIRNISLSFLIISLSRYTKESKHLISTNECLQTDWSKEGFGYLLLQKYCFFPATSAPTCCPEGWHLVFAGSQSTTETES